MNRLYKILALCACIVYPSITNADNLWQPVGADLAPKNIQLMHPASFLTYTLDETTLKLQMFSLGTDPAQGMTINLPLPDGTYRQFTVWQTPMMPGELAAKYPGIKTFTAEATDDRWVTAKLDFTLYGFHAMIYDGMNTSFIDPFDAYSDGLYMVHYKKDETRAYTDRTKCEVHTVPTDDPAGKSMQLINKRAAKPASKTINGYELRTYRLALCANSHYCAAAPVSTTVAAALSKMTTTMNRVNGVYERELSVTLTFVTNEDRLIWPAASGGVNGDDPFDFINSDANGCLDQNQITCDNVIGVANYDLGHVFTTGEGGLSNVGIVCQAGSKATSVTGLATPFGDGFDIDYVAHEMGHELGANHAFSNNVDNSCAGNFNPETAFEPGSGSTIMAYASVCAPDNIQYHSDAYFHAINLMEIQWYLNDGPGDGCAVKTPTGNRVVGYPPFSATYSIPYLTPFELYAPAIIDSVENSDNLYCWEQWDTGNGARLINTHLTGPLFRSYTPRASNFRVFPNPFLVASGNLFNDHTDGNEGEKVPDVARALHFKCSFRDIFHGLGCFTIPDDGITLNAINTGSGFTVTSQGTTGISYNGMSTHTVTWNIVGTNAAPFNAANVDIYMSVDNGITWAYYVGNFPNAGSADITVPNPAMTTASARFKVKGTGNVFFNLNKNNFVVVYNAAYPVSPNTAGVQPVQGLSDDVKIYPVPANNILHVSVAGVMQAIAYNSIGQLVWKGEVNKQVDIPVALWAKGIYYMQLADEGHLRVVKKFVVQ